MYRMVVLKKIEVQTSNDGKFCLLICKKLNGHSGNFSCMAFKNQKLTQLNGTPVRCHECIKNEEKDNANV